MIEFPYGIADFRSIRREGLVYVDRTAQIRDLEALGRILVFLRPRRFGKSLWLQTLANYYDLRGTNEFEELFGDLAIGRNPTPLANRYFVLQWNFSKVDPSGGVQEITKSLQEHIASQARTFAAHYQIHLPCRLDVEGSPATIIDNLLRVVAQTPHKLYLLIDEYDNFMNEVMVQDVGTYRALFGKEGPYRQLFKSVKGATEGQGLERVFITGVSPVALNDLTSGFNNSEDVSLEPVLASLCGFREREVRDLLGLFADELEFSPAKVEATVHTMRTWYNGYRFTDVGWDETEPKDELVYNPTNALYFLKNLYRNGVPPKQIYDSNLRTDRSKLTFIAHTAAGAGVIERLAEGDGEIVIPRLETSFSVEDLTARLAEDRGTVASFLYYMGLLTLASGIPTRLKVPNLVVTKLFLDRLLEIYLPGLEDNYESREIAMGFFQDGALQPLLDFFEKKFLPVFSNRDHGAAPRKQGLVGSGMNEMVVKALFLSMLFDDTRFVTHSELELEKTYADLCLLVRPEMRRHGFFDLLFEFKLVRRKELGLRGRELKEMDEVALRQLPRVAKAFTEARAQVKHYRTALERQLKVKQPDRDLPGRLRSYVVVAVGLERILGEEIGL